MCRTTESEAETETETEPVCRTTEAESETETESEAESEPVCRTTESEAESEAEFPYPNSASRSIRSRFPRIQAAVRASPSSRETAGGARPSSSRAVVGSPRRRGL